jgi:hypothetical protein
MEDRRQGCFDVRDIQWMGGDITDEGASRILLDLKACGVTGLWEIYHGSRVYRLAMRSGIPIHAFPGKNPWLLGEVLAFLGAPVRGGADELQKTIALNPGRSGEVLVEQGLIHPKYVEWALKEQICLRAAEFLSLREGRYRIWAGPQFLKNVPRQPDRWRPEELIEAIRRPHVANDDLRVLLGKLSDEDPLRALGLEPGAEPAQIRAAFLELARTHHPDHVAPTENAGRQALHRLVFEASVRAYEQALAA